MRFWGRVITLLCLSVALLSTGVAYADISPIAKPADSSVSPLPKPHVKAAVQPTPAPRVTPAAKPTVTPTPTATSTKPTVTASASAAQTPTVHTATVRPPSVNVPQRTVTPPVHVKTPPVRIKVASINGGRDLTAIGELENTVVRSKVVQRLFPTKLAVVGLHDALPSPEAWPDWLLATIAILASAEAFLLTRLAGSRHFMEPSER
jgi:hypothetical protein